MTDKQIERLAHHYGQVLEMDLMVTQPLTTPTPADAKRHYAMMDGSMVFVREQGWRELKLGRVFAESSCYKAKKPGVISASHYVTHLGGHEDFLAKFDQTLSHKSDLIAVGDGARWIWDFWDIHHPEAVQILDYFHAIEKIGTWAVLAIKDKGSVRDWLAVCESLLLANNLGEVQEMIEGVDYQGYKAEKRHALLTYLSNNKRWMQYKTYLEQGLFIGSGAMESANKSVIQKRLKFSG